MGPPGLGDVLERPRPEARRGPVQGTALSLRRVGRTGSFSGAEDGVLLQAAASVRGPPAGPAERRAAAARMARALVRRSTRAR